jgi:hypothetical protein
MPATRKEMIVATIDMPPPRAIVERWYLSSVGRATKPVSVANFLVTAVKQADTTNEQSSKIIPKCISDTLSVSPVFKPQTQNPKSQTSTNYPNFQIPNIRPAWF